MTDLPLAYNSNLHPAESLAEMTTTMASFGAGVRERLGWEHLGVDLRLGSQAIAEAQTDPAALTELRRTCDQHGLMPYSINAFPLVPFQADVVKQQVYAPDWATDQRLADSIAAIAIAGALSDVSTITISTLPGTFKGWRPDAAHQQQMAANLGLWAAAAARWQHDTGRTAILCIEPEPCCFVETSQECADWWQQAITTTGLTACATALDGDADAARQALDQHIGWCFDTCHISVAFEDQTAAAERFRRCGAGVAKVQLSACLEADPTDADAIEALKAMHEPRFLHQTAARSATGDVERVTDIDQIDQLLAGMPDAEAVRSHFHIPIDRAPSAAGLHSTISDSLAGLAACRGDQPHVAVETYTWSILADDDGDRMAGTAAELAWLADRLS